MKIWIGLALALFAYIFFTAGNQPLLIDVSKTPSAQAQKNNVLSQSVFRKPAATTALAQPSLDPLKVKLKTLADLKACYESRTCAFEDSDSRSYEIELGKKIKNELASFRRTFARNPAAHKDLLKTAKDFMQTGDGYVQEEAIKIFSELPPSQESLAAITEGLQTSPDPSLMEQALTEFKRYVGSALETQVHTFLSSTISTGAQFSALTVSEKIQPFLNSQSYPIYQKALSEMTPGEKAANNLNAALREYRRLQTGA